jgi:hypothetical protein
MEGTEFWFRTRCEVCQVDSPKVYEWGKWSVGWTAPVKGQAQTFRCPEHGVTETQETPTYVPRPHPIKRGVFDAR